MKPVTSPSKWWEFPPDVYLDRRHRNWVVAEELGDVRFVAGAAVVLVHRERARHIADALGAGPDVARLDELVARPAAAPREPVRRPAPSAGGLARGAARTLIARITSRARAILGGLGIVAGAAVFVTALVLPLDDPALVVALMLAVRGGRMILAVESPPAAPASVARSLATRPVSMPRERRA
jgi:hypothetical protein